MQVAHASLPTLLSTSLQRQSINELAALFKATIVDVSLDSVIIELTAKPSRIDAFIQLLKPFGILEAARSGAMAMPRSKLLGLDEKVEEAESSGIDATALPPG
jgi:acetolactate synthase-1/3 small subunit